MCVLSISGKKSDVVMSDAAAGNRVGCGPGRGSHSRLQASRSFGRWPRAGPSVFLELFWRRLLAKPERKV